MIRHAAAAAFPVVPLPVAVIEPPLRALLVPPVGVPPLLPLCFLPASLAAVPVAPVTMATDPEHRATANTPANPAAQELLAGPHPRPCGGTGQPRPVMAISIPSTDDVGPFFRDWYEKTRPPANGQGFPFPASAPPCQRLGKPHRRRRFDLPLSAPIQKKRGPEVCYPLPPFPLCGAERGPLLSDGHERMQAVARKRNGLIPAGKTSGSLGGPVKAIRDTSPPALHHFTQADQVNQLVAASEVDPDLGFMARLMALCSLPRTNPGQRYRYVRRNGPYTLVLSATGLNKLPFGNLPRLLLAWVCTEAVRTQSRELVLGRSLSEFMRTLGIGSDSGGSRGDLTRLRNQMKRLFRCTVSLNYEDERGDASVSSSVADRAEFWWSARKPDQPVLWESKIYLGEAFFNEIINHPVPLDMNTLKALKRCSLGIDLYLWLSYRIFSLRVPLQLSWRQLYRQFGTDPAKATDKRIIKIFRRQALRELKKIKLAWPGLNYTTAPGMLILHPSTPAIAPTSGRPKLVS